MSLDHHNFDYDLGAPDIPFGIGDRYFGQDQVRDFWYQQDSVGKALIDGISDIPLLLGIGGIVTQGAGSTLNITPAIGYHQKDVSVPDSFAALPPTKKTETLDAIRVVSTLQTDMALPGLVTGGATNYVKLAYDETDGPTRQRAKKIGTYAYERIRSFSFVVDGVANTDKELLLNTFTEAAGVFTFTGTRDKALFPRIDQQGNDVHFSAPFQEYTYLSGDLDKIEYFESASKALLLATKQYTYSSGDVSTITMTVGISVWTMTFTFDGNGDLFTVSVVRT